MRVVSNNILFPPKIEEVVSAPLFEMEENVRKRMLYFDGKTDLTFREVKIWKAFLNSLVEAQRNYYNHLNESANILKKIGLSEDEKKTTGESTRFAADMMQEVLGNLGVFHRDVLGDFDKYTSIHGPFSNLLESTDSKFDLLKKTAATQLKEHHKMEQAAEKAWKYYKRRVKKQTCLEVKLLKTLTEEQLKSDNKCIKFYRKTYLAKSKYQTCFQNEARHRALLVKQGENLRRDFLKQEKEKLDMVFTSINTMFTKLHQLAPQGIRHLDDDKFDLGPVQTKAIAMSIWDNALNEHIFPDKKEEDIKGRDLRDIDNGNMSDDEDDSDDDEEDEHDDDDDVVCPLFERQVESLRAPKVVNDGLNDVLQEIMDSLDNKPAYETLRAEPTSRVLPPQPAPSTSNGGAQSHPRSSLQDDQARQEPVTLTHAALDSSDEEYGRRGRRKAKASVERTGKSQNRRGSSSQREEQRESTSLQHAKLDSSDEEYGPKMRRQAKASAEKVGVSSDARRRRREAKAESEDKKRPSTSRTRKSAPDVTVSKASRPAPKQEKTTVYAIADWKKRNQDDISIRVGMKIKMTVGMNHMGMAYGYKKTKFGMRKHGFFPAALVSCISPK